MSNVVLAQGFVQISCEEYLSLQASELKVSQVTETNALLSKHVENLGQVVTRKCSEIATLELDLSFAKARYDILYETPASGIKYDGVAAVQAAAPAAAAEKPLDAPPAASSPKEPSGAPPAATAGNGILKAIGGFIGLGAAGAAGVPPAAPPPPPAGWKPKPTTGSDADAAAGGPAKDEPKRHKETAKPAIKTGKTLMEEMAEKTAKRALNGAAMKAVNCREENLEAARQAQKAAAITADESRKQK